MVPKKRNNKPTTKYADSLISSTSSDSSVQLPSKTVEFISTLESRLEDLEGKIITDKASLLTIFGIFASIVTFVSLELQILKSICDYDRLIGISLFSLGGLLSFVFILQYITKSWIERDYSISIKELRNDIKTFNIKINPSLLLGLFVIILTFGFGSYYVANAQETELSCQKIKLEEMFQKLENTYINRVEQLDKQNRKQFNILEEEYSKKIDKAIKTIQEHNVISTTEKLDLLHINFPYLLFYSTF